MSHDEIAAKLVRMANQIAGFFRSQPEETQVEGIANHINKFWEPRMRRQFFAMIEEGHDGFDPLVILAADKVNRPAAVMEVKASA
ncbi:formate dehydrogenase subunit delta [Allorhizobium sp. BGMRC 0089]|uniref:formate dehydrogenase subunit delta n=1 Tax=Allorhizobium sonneratiae TaxID=2934936 RepID=UPI0020346F56|nr:formate dehydrogenase subunit delta [Allorhizobium sonneratiae]MCM2293385.1 formate dehydrogenase subunit delta [Allorhizobium sonneratiae]